MVIDLSHQGPSAGQMDCYISNDLGFWITTKGPAFLKWKPQQKIFTTGSAKGPLITRLLILCLLWVKKLYCSFQKEEAMYVSIPYLVH